MLTPCLRMGLVALLALAGPPTVHAARSDSDRHQAVSAKLDGQLIAVQEADFDYQSTLQNYLRRGSDAVFAPSEPGLYLKAESERDIVTGVQFALDNGLKVAFHGSGHHQAGLSLYPGGMTIDVSQLKDAFVDPHTQTGRFQIGLIGEEVANITQAYDLHYRIGHASSVGIAGFTLGGGGGWAGLAVDTVIAMDVVNVWEYPAQELTVKRVDAFNWPELFFGLQGAGGMLGAVAAIYAELQPLPSDHLIRASTLLWPLPHAAQAWETWEAYNAHHTRSQLVESAVQYVTIPGVGPTALVGTFDWSTDNRTGTTDFIDGLLEAGQHAGAMTMDNGLPYYPDLVHFSSKMQEYPNVTHYSISQVIALQDMPAASEILSAGYANVTSPLSIILVNFPDKQLKSNDDTAYGWRGTANIYIWAFWTRTSGGPQVDGDAEHVAWVKEIASQLDSISMGHYINFIDFEKPEDTQRCFPPANWARVVAAKAEYDPYNLFRELDFYHNDNGMGPLDAGKNSAVQVVNVGGK